MTQRKAAWFAFAASFAVYLLPLIGPHAAWLLGQTLFQKQPGQSAQWTAANWAVALLVQFLAAGLLFWFFRHPVWRRGIPLLFALPIVFWTVQLVYLVVLPTKFMEEPDVAAENAALPLECTAPGVFQTNLRTPSELWVRFNDHPNQYAVLTMPGCKLASVTLPEPKFTPGAGVDFMIDVTSVVPGGMAIVQKYLSKEAKQSWWLVPGTQAQNDASLLPLEPPANYSGNNGPPILSMDGQWVTWLATIPGSGPPVLNRVILRPRYLQANEKTVDLSAVGPANYVLKKVDIQSEELTLWRNDRLIVVGFDGKLKNEFDPPAALRPQDSTYLAMGKYWLAWDAYRDSEPYLVEWSLPFGSGSHRVPLGRSINSAAFDPAGKWVAVSVATSLNIGKAQDAVYVLSASNGREIFRKYLPRYTRSPVAFVEGGFFLYSDHTGVHALRVPE